MDKHELIAFACGVCLGVPAGIIILLVWAIIYDLIHGDTLASVGTSDHLDLEDTED